MVLVLRNHGTLVVGSTPVEAFSAMWHLEKACEAQIDAMSTGAELNMPVNGIAEQIARLGFNRSDGLAEYGNKRSPAGWKEWPSLLRKLDRELPGYRD
jgi:ribulose-5-phosphate 4-epimerase/fuculose-1-phosphate aldolase